MKLGAAPENFVERLGFLFGVLPPGIVERWLGIMIARSMMTATKLDIFEALAGARLRPRRSRTAAKRITARPNNC